MLSLKFTLLENTPSLHPYKINFVFANRSSQALLLSLTKLSTQDAQFILWIPLAEKLQNYASRILSILSWIVQSEMIQLNQGPMCNNYLSCQAFFLVTKYLYIFTFSRGDYYINFSILYFNGRFASFISKRVISSSSSSTSLSSGCNSTDAAPWITPYLVKLKKKKREKRGI